MRRFVQTLGLFWAASSVPSAAVAQWLEQSFQLQPGWNSVYLEVDPEPAEADALFAGLPLDAVWTRVPDRLVEGPTNCTNPDDPACAPPDTSGWWVWTPPDDPAGVATTLRLIRGGRVYLLKVSSAVTWTVVGMPDGSTSQWRRGLNLAGLRVTENAAATPTFTSYFNGSPAHTGAAIFAIQSDGSPVRITNPLTTPIVPGRGYWISSLQAVAYDGPVAIDRGSLRGVDFGQDLFEHALELVNQTSLSRTLSAAYMASSAVPVSAPPLPSHAGEVPMLWLEYVDAVPPDQALQWHSLGSASWPLSGIGTPGGRRTVRLSVDRAGLAPALLDPLGQGSQYQGLLRLTDGQGFRRWLAVRTQVLAGAVAHADGAVAGAMGQPGLYFGHVTVDRVAWITAGARIWTNTDPNDPELAINPDVDTNSLRPTPASFVFPVLIHLSASGQFRMLTEVTLLFQPGDEKTSTPGRFILATPSCGSACDPLLAGSIQDGQPFARRFSSAAFAFDDDLALTGDFTTSLAGQSTLPADHRLNPFHHRYHPDHDCDSEGECFEVVRNFAFSFSSEPPVGQSPAGWGEMFLGGDYTEMLTGLHKNPIRVAGRFDLRRVSNVPELNVQN